MNTELNRREFLKLSALAGTGLSFGGLFGLKPKEIFAITAATNGNGLRTNITPIAIAHDCARLVVHSPETSRRIKETLTRHWEEMGIGGILRSGEEQAVGLIDSCRAAFKSDSYDDFSGRKLAFTTGWLFHRAANLELYAFGGEEGRDEKMERMIYHDAYLLREFSLSEDNESAPDPIRGARSKAKADDVYSLFKSVTQRTLLRLHTFDLDERDVDSWVPNLIRWSQGNETLLRRYAEAYAAPDPDKMRRLVYDGNFYDRTNPVIRLARSLKDGVIERAVGINAAVEMAASQSQYARALRRGIHYLLAVNDYFNEAIDDKTLRNRLQIG